MNQLRSWLYGRDFEETTKFPQNDQIDQGKDQLSKRSDSKSLDSKLQQAALRVIPLKTGDCLGCKLVGTSVMMASGIIVIGSAMAGKNRNPSLKGLKGAAYFSLCGLLFVGFETAAVCRLMDWGPFDKSVKPDIEGTAGHR
ncbi:uncharacterized protein LOC101861683 isoform X2 [Aplysia californica]|uniref:Uncharacterized protein LOC101861683 isoform X2 n=1 Tax=Aplysia californica TaxID=6500 RepID=A0ABM1VZE9_APLCA|nr:uncharacterized protein LOC101861683 isoform X2 [Aplysia californica]